MVRIALIAAVAENGVIGNNNELPWRIPADLKYFKQVTTGKPIIMGRLTYESIGKALPGRTNIVVSATNGWSAVGVEVVRDLKQALTRARQVAVESGVDEVMVIGGASIYQASLPLAQRLYLTRVLMEVAGDTYFPDLHMADWTETLVCSAQEDGQTPACTFVRLDRIR